MTCINCDSVINAPPAMLGSDGSSVEEQCVCESMAVGHSRGRPSHQTN